MSKNAKPMHEEKKRLSLHEDRKKFKNSHVRVKESAGGVCVWERTDSPATHHCSAITAQLTTKVFNLVVD